MSGKSVKYRAPYEIPTVSNYRFAAKRFIKHVEFYLKRKNKELERLGIEPEYRKEYLDSVIDTEFATKLRKYKKMYNRDCIRLERVIERRRTDKEDFTKLLQDIKVEIASLSAEYIAIERLYEDHFNPLYQGRLKCEGEEEDFAERDGVDE